MNTYCDENGKFPAYIRHMPVYSLDDVQNCIEHQEIIYTNSNVSVSASFRYLREVEKLRERKLSDGRKARYGSRFEALMPHGKWSAAKKVKIIKEFSKAVMGLEKLIVFAWEEVRGTATYINFYFTDREWLQRRPVHYKRDVYIDSKGHMCSPDAEDARLIHKKGDLKETQSAGFNFTKSRIFVYKDQDEESFRQRWLDFWKQALIQLNTIIQGKFVMQRKKIHYEMERYLKRVYIHQNHLMTYIENVLNRLYKARYPDGYAAYKDGGSTAEPIETKSNRILTGIFDHYSHRFKRNKFHVDGEEFKLIGRADLADANIEYLKKIFMDEIYEKFPSVFEEIKI